MEQQSGQSNAQTECTVSIPQNSALIVAKKIGLREIGLQKIRQPVARETHAPVPHPYRYSMVIAGQGRPMIPVGADL
jgi:hypothetical protein